VVRPAGESPVPARRLAALRRAVLAHYDAHRRTLPWRGETDPYRVWVSEVLLQQTRVETVRERFPAFLAAFPTLGRLAAAAEDDVLLAWEGLGYYARARNLRRAAQEVVARHGGRLPDTAQALRALPGFGPYTAAAVASIAFGRPEAVVDGNVARVLARVLDEARDAGRADVRARVEATARALLDPARPGDWNQALMDLGATVCVPRAPRCGECPLAPWCEGRRSGRAPSLPRKRAKVAVPHHEIALGLVWRAGRLLIGRRPADGLLGGLHECPGGKREPGETLEAACEREVREETGLRVRAEAPVATVRHAYTHFRVTLHAFHCRVLGGRLRPRGTEALRFVRPADLHRYAFPRANRRVFEALAASGPPPFARSRARSAHTGPSRGPGPPRAQAAGATERPPRGAAGVR
jgi:A/G-specific adenine glycosylase